MKLRWQNKRCSHEGLLLMEAAVRRVEERLASAADDTSSVPIHIPTIINDELYQDCICICVAPNASEGCCFRGMEVTQFEIQSKVYNIAILRRVHVNDVAAMSSANERNQQKAGTSEVQGFNPSHS